jgi:DNA-directed RNA polymerase I subunit RPA43
LTDFLKLYSLGGILAGYGNLTIKNPKADLLFDLSNIHVDVVGDFYIFNPEVKKELTGKIVFWL